MEFKPMEFKSSERARIWWILSFSLLPILGIVLITYLCYFTKLDVPKPIIGVGLVSFIMIIVSIIIFVTGLDHLSTLKLDKNGIEMKGPFGRQRLNWTEIGGADIIRPQNILTISPADRDKGSIVFSLSVLPRAGQEIVKGLLERKIKLSITHIEPDTLALAGVGDF